MSEKYQEANNQNLTNVAASLKNEETERDNEFKATFSLVTQGNHKFYCLTLESNLLAEICFVSTRYEDPKEGFQRTLDIKRSQQIAEYIDNGLGTIPNSIILSAQPEAAIKIIKRGKILSFLRKPKSFLILDGQHRVHGFSLAKSHLRVPVVIYDGLSRTEESRLFIDINTKQRPVPNELLLDIKKLAEYETDIERVQGEIYDLFNNKSDSPLLGLMSPSERQKGKISRTTFNAGIKPIIGTMTNNTTEEIYVVIRAYLEAFCYGMREMSIEDCVTKPIVFRAMIQFFIKIAPRVKFQFNGKYTADNFYEVLKPVFAEATQGWFRNARTMNSLYGKLEKAIDKNFTL
jgi:DGQHR domain-containing protein